MERFFEVLNEVNARNPPTPPNAFAMCIDNYWEAGHIVVKEVLDNGNA